MKQNNNLTFWQWALIFCVAILFFKLESGIWNLWEADTLYTKSQNYQKINRHVEGYQVLSQAIEKLPNEPVYADEMSQLATTLALAATEEKQATLSSQLIKMAITYSDRTINQSSENVVFFKTRVRVLYSLSLLDKTLLPQALKAITRAVELAPTDAKISYFYGLILDLNGKKQEAIKALEHTVEMKPDYRDAHFQLARAYLESGAKDLAKQQAEFIIAKIGDDEEVKNWLKEQKL